MAYLATREGKRFALEERPVELPKGGSVEAIVPLYRGRDLAASADIAALAKLERRATGTSGTCADYVRGVAAQLKELGIEDAGATAFSLALQTAPL